MSAEGTPAVIADLVEFGRLLWDELETLRDRIIDTLDPEGLWDDPADDAAQPFGSRTRPTCTDRTYFSPGATVYDTDARQAPSGQRTQPSCSPGYQTPSSCRTSTTRGGSYRRELGSVTAPTVGPR